MNFKSSFITLSAIVFFLGSSNVVLANKEYNFSVRKVGRGVFKGVTATCTAASLLSVVNPGVVQVPQFTHLLTAIGLVGLTLGHISGIWYDEKETNKKSSMLDFILPLNKAEGTGLLFGMGGSAIWLYNLCKK